MLRLDQQTPPRRRCMRHLFDVEKIAPCVGWFVGRHEFLQLHPSIFSGVSTCNEWHSHACHISSRLCTPFLDGLHASVFIIWAEATLLCPVTTCLRKRLQNSRYHTNTHMTSLSSLSRHAKLRCEVELRNPGRNRGRQGTRALTASIKQR